jgi:hypothetical protein
MTCVGQRQPVVDLLIEILRRRELPARHERRSEEPVAALDHAFGLRVARFEQLDFGSEVPANAAVRSVSLPLPMPVSLSQISRGGTA